MSYLKNRMLYRDQNLYSCGRSWGSEFLKVDSQRMRQKPLIRNHKHRGVKGFKEDHKDHLVVVLQSLNVMRREEGKQGGKLDAKHKRSGNREDKLEPMKASWVPFLLITTSTSKCMRYSFLSPWWGRNDCLGHKVVEGAILGELDESDCCPKHTRLMADQG